MRPLLVAFVSDENTSSTPMREGGRPLLYFDDVIYPCFLTDNNTQRDGVRKKNSLIFLRTGFLVHNATCNMAHAKIMQCQPKNRL